MIECGIELLAYCYEEQPAEGIEGNAVGALGILCVEPPAVLRQIRLTVIVVQAVQDGTQPGARNPLQHRVVAMSSTC